MFTEPMANKWLLTGENASCENNTTKIILYIIHRLQSHAIQRSNFVDEDGSSYLSPTKKQYKLKAKNVGKK